MNDTIESTPQTEPGQPVTTSKPRKKSAKQAPKKSKPKAVAPKVEDPKPAPPPPSKLSGSDLMRKPGPDAEGSTRELKVWIGLREDCPVPTVRLVGTTFSKTSEQIIEHPAQPGQRLRVPVKGVITAWTRRTFDLLAVAIPRRIIRYDNPPEGKKKKGHVFRIPTDAENKIAIERNRPARYHTDRPDDEPIAKYLYVVFFKDGETPKHGLEVPPTLDITGLAWPKE